MAGAAFGDNGEDFLRGEAAVRPPLGDPHALLGIVPLAGDVLGDIDPGGGEDAIVIVLGGGLAHLRTATTTYIFYFILILVCVGGASFARRKVASRCVADALCTLIFLVIAEGYNGHACVGDAHNHASIF